MEYYSTFVTILDTLLTIFIALSVVVALDRALFTARYAYMKVRMWWTGKKPEEHYPFATLPDAKACGMLYPMVVVQIPCCNERGVCQVAIDHVAAFDWPRERLIVQICDDSEDQVTKDMIDDKVAEWQEAGTRIEVMRRGNRIGYKAGALAYGMKLFGDSIDYVAVFDSDFQPSPSFLRDLIPYLIANPTVGWVQSRWVFTNPDESYLTKAQQLSLNYHFNCEQRVCFATGTYFGFNGTGGIWRRTCIENIGGWNHRTTVEDMDLSLRCHLAGWKCIYVNDVTSWNELPASLFAYRKQQHRWSAGPTQLIKLAMREVLDAKISVMQKLDILVCCFGLRKMATHLVTLGFFCLLLPLVIVTPEITVPIFAIVHLPSIITLSTAWFTPSGWMYIIMYVLFENAMSIVKLNAVIAGAFNLKGVNEWVVTTKTGSGSAAAKKANAQVDDDAPAADDAAVVPVRTLYVREMIFGAYMIVCAIIGLRRNSHWGFSVYLSLQGMAFLAFAFNLVDQGQLLGRPLDTHRLRQLPAIAAPAAKLKGLITESCCHLRGINTLIKEANSRQH